MPTWTQRLSIGVASIDEQHRQLFGQADGLLAAMKKGRPAEEVRQVIQFLDEYCRSHFLSEEGLMREMQHRGLEEHLREHALFTERFQEITDRFLEKGPSLSVTVDLQELLCSWLVGHVASVDVELAPAASARHWSVREPSPLIEVRAPPSEGDPGDILGPRGTAAQAVGAAGRGFKPEFIQDKGKGILRLDFARLSPAELLQAFVVAGRTISSAPGPQRILTVLTTSVTPETAAVFKAYALRNRPHVFASAIVATSFWKVIVTDLLVHGREDLTLFDREADALSWLASR